ncbi:Probable LRR receptor-like serine/threonine-protein kinase RKF3 [Linum grandiflorum]
MFSSAATTTSFTSHEKNPTITNDALVLLRRLVNDALPNFDIRSSCGFQTNWSHGCMNITTRQQFNTLVTNSSQGCMNITTRQQFNTLVTNSSLSDVVSSCNQPLENNSPCAACLALDLKLRRECFRLPSLSVDLRCGGRQSFGPQ